MDTAPSKDTCNSWVVRKMLGQRVERVPLVYFHLEIGDLRQIGA